MAGPRGWDRQAAPPPPPYLADRGHRQGTGGPPLTPPPPPPSHTGPRAGGVAPPPPPAPTPAGEPQARPSAPPGPGGRPHPQEERRHGKGSGGWTCPHEPTPACRSNAHNGARRRPRPTWPSRDHSPLRGERGGVCRSAGAPRGAVHGPPLTPPRPGAARQPRPHARAGGEGQKQGYHRPPPGTRAGRPQRDTPPEARGMGPPTREGGRSVTRPPAPAAGPQGGREEQTGPRRRTGTPHRSYPERLGEHEPEWYGGPRPPWTAQRQ